MQEIRQFLLMLRERGESAASIKMYVASLHFLYGVTLGRPAVAANIPWPRVVQKLPAVVSREEVEALLGKSEPLKCRMVVMTAYGTGLRISEILALETARDIGTIFRRHGGAFRRSNALGARERRALRDISVCRTGALGGHRDVCNTCGCEREVYNSCRNRHCPKCQALRQARWVSARMQRALPVRHFHVVFTLPAELRELVRTHEALLLDLLFDSAAEAFCNSPAIRSGLVPCSALPQGQRI